MSEAEDRLVLMLDARLTWRDLAIRALGSDRVVPVGNTAAALRLLREVRPALVVVGQLPHRETAESAVRAIVRANSTAVPLAIVVLLAQVWPGADRAVLAAGAVACLPLAIDVPSLCAQVDASLAYRRQCLASATTQERDRCPRFIERVRALVEAQYHEEGFDVLELAGQLKLSRAQLYRRLHDAIGMSPSALIRERRMQRAGELLLVGGSSVCEIAQEVGFSSQDGFSRAFRQRHGCLPSQFTRQAKSTVCAASDVASHAPIKMRRTVETRSCRTPRLGAREGSTGQDIQVQLVPGGG